MAIKLTNNAVTKLAAGINNSATSLQVTPGEGARFPTLAEGDWFPATLIDVNGNLEIVRVTERSTDTFTITRAQEGTAAIAFSAGDRVELRMTAGTLEAYFAENAADFGAALTAGLAPKMDKAANLSDLADAAASRTNLGVSTPQSSATDATAGRGLIVGAFGLGASTAILSADFNAITVSGIYYGSNATNAPEASKVFSVLHLQASGSTNAVQYALWVGGDDLWIRRKNAGTWTTWVKVYHTGNLTIPDGTTSVKGIVQLSTSTSSTSTTLAATASAVKAAYDLASSKQDAGNYAGFYSGTTNSETNLPIGSLLIALSDNSWGNNTSQLVRFSNAYEYRTASGSSQLSGTWRARGSMLVDSSGPTWLILMQRVA